jgi:hypothetical protein
MQTHYSVGAAAAQFGVPAWKVRRLFERGLLPPAARVGPYRIIPGSELPDVERALKKVGYLPEKDRPSAGGGHHVH